MSAYEPSSVLLRSKLVSLMHITNTRYLNSGNYTRAHERSSVLLRSKLVSHMHAI
jgi:hypothetical protein